VAVEPTVKKRKKNYAGSEKTLPKVNKKGATLTPSAKKRETYQ
jgi:hypothetical protein